MGGLAGLGPSALSESQASSWLGRGGGGEWGGEGRSSRQLLFHAAWSGWTRRPTKEPPRTNRSAKGGVGGFKRVLNGLRLDSLGEYLVII